MFDYTLVIWIIATCYFGALQHEMEVFGPLKHMMEVTATIYSFEF